MASPFAVPLNALRAIEIVARRGALAPAADELGVTPGAVSQHLRRAEERLGIELFSRTPQGLVPTAALRSIAPQLTEGFDTLAGALKSLRRDDDETVLTITVASVFASRWLIWRVAKFTALHPEIELRMVVSPVLVDLRHADIDAAIRYGRGSWPGVKAELIGGSLYRPVCAPELAGQIKSPTDLIRVPVIHETTSMLSWADWFRAAGIGEMPEFTGPTITDSTLAFDAAISGQGVLLAVDMMSADAVSDGRLVRPFPMAVKSDLGYWLAVADNKRESRKVRRFRDWLRVEAPDSARGYVDQAKRRR